MADGMPGGHPASISCSAVGVGYRVSPAANAVAGDVELVGSDLLRYEPLSHPILSKDDASFADQVSALVDAVTVAGSPTHTSSLKTAYAYILKYAGGLELGISQSDFSALFAAERLLVQSPTPNECRKVPPAKWARKPTGAYVRYQRESLEIGAAVDAVRSACAAVSNDACRTARQRLAVAQTALAADLSAAGVERALEVRSRVALRDPRLRISDAYLRYQTFEAEANLWDGREGSIQAWLRNGQPPNSIPGMVEVAKQLPPGAVVRSLDPDWLDYELLTSGLFFLVRQDNTIVGDGVSIPRYLVYIQSASGTETAVLGVIKADLDTRSIKTRTTNRTDSIPPRTSFQAQNLLHEGASAYASRGNESFVKTTVDRMLAAKWNTASNEEQYRAAVWIARLSLWQVYKTNEIVGNRPGGSTPTAQADAEAFAQFVAKSSDAYRLGFLFPLQIGRSEPCEGAYLIQLGQFAEAEFVHGHDHPPDMFRNVITSLSALKTRQDVDGASCDTFDSGGIDRFVGRAHYRIADSLVGPGPPSPAAVIEANLGTKSLATAYSADPLLPANVEWYIYSLLGILTKVQTPENDAKACDVFRRFRNTLIPAGLSSLTDLITRLREDSTIKALMPDCAL